MVAQEILDLLVWVRVLVPEPFFLYGAMVKRLRRRPLKAKSRVRFSLALPSKIRETKGLTYRIWTLEKASFFIPKMRRECIG